MPHIRVIVIDPHDLSRNGLQRILQQVSWLRIVGVYAALEGAERALMREQPHIVLLDDSLTGAHDLGRVVERLVAGCPDAAIMVLSSRLNGRYIQRLLLEGVSGFIYREDRLEETLSTGIETVQSGHLYVSPRASGLVFADCAAHTLDQLNPTNLEVLHLIASGLAVKEIASRLTLTQRSVYRIRTKLRTALGVHSDVHLLDAARTQGLLPRRQ
jgi:DNA-binding NarL/FixJ family response regulator